MPADDNESKTAIALVDPLVGTIFDKRFRIEERIAAGGFGAIYRAKHVKSGHPIALKVLLPALAQDLGVVARFRREGATMTTLRNPHTITAYELGQAADRMLFIVMELLSGESLFDHYSAHGPLAWRRMAKIARQVCESLEEAHALGIVHRDLKPTNIHLENHDGDPDFVKVLDFGIAKILGGSDFDASDITNAGTMIGTLDYMSPEQMVGGAVTGQTDIYTLGIVMYEMLAGTRPFPEATTAAAALAAMLKTTPQPLYLRAPVPEEISAIVMRCLERDVARRYRAVGELMADLDRALGAGDRASTLDKTRTVELDRVAPSSSRDSDGDGDDATTITPPPEKILESLRTPKIVPARPWDDEDEHSLTVAEPPGIDPFGPTVPAPPLRKRGPEDSGLELKTPTLERVDDARTPRIREDSARTPRIRDDVDARKSRSREDDSGVDVRTPTFQRQDPPPDLETVPVMRQELDEAPRGSARARPPTASEMARGAKPAMPEAARAAKPAMPDAARAARPPTQPSLSTAATPRLAQPSLPESPRAARPPTQPSLSTAAPPRAAQPSPESPRAPKPPTQPPPSSQPAPPPPPQPPPQQLMPTPRPLASRHIPTPVPNIVAAPFSSTPRSPGSSGVPTPTPGSVPPGVPLPPASSSGSSSMQNPFAQGPGSNPFAQGPGSNPFAQGPGSNPFAQGPGSNPFAQGPGSNPFAQGPGSNPFAQGPGSNPFAAPGPASNSQMPPTPMGQMPPTPRPQYDMGGMAAKEDAIRRLVWIIVLVLGTGIGILIAMRL